MITWQLPTEPHHEYGLRDEVHIEVSAHVKWTQYPPGLVHQHTLVEIDVPMPYPSQYIDDTHQSSWHQYNAIAHVPMPVLTNLTHPYSPVLHQHPQLYASHQ